MDSGIDSLGLVEVRLCYQKDKFLVIPLLVNGCWTQWLFVHIHELMLCVIRRL